MPYVPDTGHLIKLNFDPQAGHEQAGWRPALVLTPAIYNDRTGLAVVVPITNQAKGYPFEVPLPSGLKITGVVLCDHLKNLDWRARRAQYKDVAPDKIMVDIKALIARVLGIRTT